MENYKSIKTVLLVGLFALVLSIHFAVSPARANSKRGACGAPIPRSSREISKYRYRVLYPNNMFKLLKFYYKLFGKNNSDYPITRLFSLPNVVAYHLKNNSGRGRWKGLNLAYYPRRAQVQIYVICKKRGK